MELNNAKAAYPNNLPTSSGLKSMNPESKRPYEADNEVTVFRVLLEVAKDSATTVRKVVQINPNTIRDGFPLNEWADYSALFTHYKIVDLCVKHMPCRPNLPVSQATTNSNFPCVVSYVENLDLTPSTSNQIGFNNTTNSLIRQLSDPWILEYRVAPLIRTNSLASQTLQDGWIRTNNPYSQGSFLVQQVGNVGGGAGVGQVFSEILVEITVHFRNRK